MRQISINAELWLEIVAYMYDIEKQKAGNLTEREQQIIAGIDSKMETIYKRIDFAKKRNLTTDY